MSKENICPSFKSIKPKTNRGRRRSENSPNQFCRICKKTLILTYGPQQNCKHAAYCNLFKPSTRKDDFGVIIADSLKETGILIPNSPQLSSVVCHPCARKLKNLSETYKTVVQSIRISEDPPSDQDAVKRKAASTLTPERSPTNRKTRRIQSPQSKTCNSPSRNRRKSLFSVEDNSDSKEQDIENVLLSKLNVDDLDTSKCSQVKIVLAYPSGNVIVKSNFDTELKSIITNICLSRWNTVIRALFAHSILNAELLNFLELKSEQEIKRYAKTESCLKSTSPDQLASFSNKILCKELEVNCPVYNAVVRGACGYSTTSQEEMPANYTYEKTSNAVALATSALTRVQNPSMSAVAYRISTILFHSGVSNKDLTRLNHLGVCMSPQSVISMHEKMGENFDYKVLHWKKTIEENSCAISFLEEIDEKMIPKREEDDMEIEISLNLKEENVQNFSWYTPKTYVYALSLLEQERNIMGELSFTEDVLKQTLAKLQDKKLPIFK